MNDQIISNQEIEEAKDGDLISSPRHAIDPSHVAKIEPQVQKAEAVPVQAAAAQDADPELVKEIWFYVRSSKRCPGAGMIANEGIDILQELRSDIQSSLGSIEASIAECQAKKPGVEASAASPEPFQLSQITKDGIEIIEEMGIDFEDWTESFADSEWSIRTLKIWYFLQKDFASNN